MPFKATVLYIDRMEGLLLTRRPSLPAANGIGVFFTDPIGTEELGNFFDLAGHGTGIANGNLIAVDRSVWCLPHYML